MQQREQASVRVKTGVVGAYVGAGDAAFVRRVRQVVGRVTVSGKNGLRIVEQLAREGDVGGIDLDPAGYLRQESDQLELFAADWVGRQRELALPVIRSQGRYVPKGDDPALKDAMRGVLPDDVVRVVSLHETWLRGERLNQQKKTAKNRD